MKHIKKKHFLQTLCLLLAVLLLCPAWAACQAEPRGGNTVVCTGFAAYDWVRNILGERSHLSASLLVSDGSDLHSYQPTVADKVALTGSAMVVYIGGESDRWVVEMLESDASDHPAVCLSEIDGVTLRQASSVSVEENHAHVHAEGEAHHHEAFDEHIWLSLANAVVCVRQLARELGRLDAEGAAFYRENAERYCEKLMNISEEYQSVVKDAPRNALLFADRFPFVYLTEELGLSYCAAFEGCSTESEASFETVVRLAQQADVWGLSCVLVTESSDGKLANSVIGATARKEMAVLTMDSMQAVSQKRIDEGTTYLSVMTQNLNVLREALS